VIEISIVSVTQNEIAIEASQAIVIDHLFRYGVADHASLSSLACAVPFAERPFLIGCVGVDADVVSATGISTVTVLETWGVVTANVFLSETAKTNDDAAYACL
jgi:hypothetical protein